MQGSVVGGHGGHSHAVPHTHASSLQAFLDAVPGGLSSHPARAAAASHRHTSQSGERPAATPAAPSLAQLAEEAEARAAAAAAAERLVLKRRLPETCGDRQHGSVSLTRVQKRWVAKTTPNSVGYMHMPTLEATAGGELVASWQASHHREGGADQVVYYAVSYDDAATWGAARLLPGVHLAARWSPVLFQPQPAGTFATVSIRRPYAAQSEAASRGQAPWPAVDSGGES
jgi:hypothetical protein